MPQFGASRALHMRLVKTKLDSRITILGNGLGLRHDTRAGFYHSHRYRGSLWIEYLSHTDLSAQQSTEHILSSLSAIALPLYLACQLCASLGKIGAATA